MLNMDKEMKEAMDRWTIATDGMPWQGWFWAQGGDQLSNTALEHAISNNKAMLESYQAIMAANIAFFNKRMKANTDYIQEIWDCPTGIELSKLTSDFMQQAFEDCRQEGARQMNQMSSTMKGTVSKTQKATSEALTSIDDLKAMAQAAPTKVPAKPRRRVPRKSTSTRTRAKNADKPSASRAPGKKGVSA
ncbi:phasin family protein [Pseudovibrio denitrificans]|uniref:phasin family protein n=1 Tax=Pseudovibrio denitrificans TaxID=258256 RepID=UPI0039BEF942